MQFLFAVHWYGNVVLLMFNIQLASYCWNATTKLDITWPWCLAAEASNAKSHVNELLQILAKHKPSEDLDEGQWAQFLAQYMKGFVVKTHDVPSLITAMHEAYSCFMQPVADGKLRDSDWESLHQVFQPVYIRLHRHFLPGYEDVPWWAMLLVCGMVI